MKVVTRLREYSGVSASRTIPNIVSTLIVAIISYRLATVVPLIKGNLGKICEKIDWIG